MMRIFNKKNRQGREYIAQNSMGEDESWENKNFESLWSFLILESTEGKINGFILKQSYLKTSDQISTSRYKIIFLLFKHKFFQ